jgi:hypothetical protein
MITRLIRLGALLAALGSADAQQGSGALRPAAPDTLIALSAGNATTCATTARGAGYCWGELGPRRGQVYRILDADGRPALLRATSPGWLILCAQTLDGGAACSPSLTGATTNSAGKWTRVASCDYSLCVLSLPKRGVMPAGPLRAVDAGWTHACALSLDGSAFCWGTNDQGQLGIGHWAADSTGSTGETVRIPSAVATEYRFATLSAGENTTCGITEPGAAIYCWGYGQSGQTGDSSVMTSCSGTKPYYDKPCSNAVPSRVRVETLPGTRAGGASVRFAQVSVGMRLACAVSVGGAAYCWGGNYRCALGRCRESDSPLAHNIPLPGRVAEIGAGYQHACARTVDRRIFCWGDNSAGQLGSLVSANLDADGLPPDYRDTTNHALQGRAYDDPCFLGGRCSPAPVEVSPGRRWSALAVGSQHACALADDDGGVHCWGGTETAAVGLGIALVPCLNRSTQWQDVQCQATPVRVPGLPRLATRAAAATSIAAVRVTVSRREVRAVFPLDEGGTWGWSALVDPGYEPWYHWGISVEGMDGPRSLLLLVGRTDSSARRFPTLQSLVAAGMPSLCSAGMMGPCTRNNVSARVEGGHVVLVLRDSAEIARLFGLRPATVGVWQSRPSAVRDYQPVRATVEYVEPQLAVPDAAALAEGRASRRRYEAGISTITRRIKGADVDDGGPFWLAVGDSIPVSVQESSCHYDVCGVDRLPVLGDSLWTVGDSSIARLRAAPSPRALARVLGAPMQVIGRRPGRTFLRIVLPPLASDTAPSSSPPGRVLTRDVVVTRPIRHIAFVPRPDSVRVGEALMIRLRATDDEGRDYENPPARVMVNDGVRSYVTLATDAIRLDFTSPGTRTIVARLGALSDTLTLRVLETP